MSEIFEYVDVQISREIETVSRTGFGTALFVGETEGAQADPVVRYTSADEVAETFASGDPEVAFAEVYFGQSERPEALYIATKAELDSYSDALDAAVAADDDWYAVAIQSRTDADIEEVAGWAQARDKIFVGVGSAVALAETLLTNSYDRTAFIYHSDAAEEWPDAGILGRMLPTTPGSETWAWKSLSGVATDSVSSSDRATLDDNRGNYYIRLAGNNVLIEGYTSDDGGYVDITRGIDWLKFRLAEDLIARLAAVGKIPYVGGDSEIESIIRARLDEGVDNGLIADDYEVTVPPASEQSPTNRADRIYNNVTFNAQLVGAVHRVNVRGTVTV